MKKIIWIIEKNVISQTQEQNKEFNSWPHASLKSKTLWLVNFLVLYKYFNKKKWQGEASYMSNHMTFYSLE
jgi:hypothetical protein